MDDAGATDGVLIEMAQIAEVDLNNSAPEETETVALPETATLPPSVHPAGPSSRERVTLSLPSSTVGRRRRPCDTLAPLLLFITIGVAFLAFFDAVERTYSTQAGIGMRGTNKWLAGPRATVVFNLGLIAIVAAFGARVGSDERSVGKAARKMSLTYGVLAFLVVLLAALIFSDAPGVCVPPDAVVPPVISRGGCSSLAAVQPSLSSVCPAHVPKASSTVSGDRAAAALPYSFLGLNPGVDPFVRTCAEQATAGGDKLEDYLDSPQALLDKFFLLESFLAILIPSKVPVFKRTLWNVSYCILLARMCSEYGCMTRTLLLSVNAPPRRVPTHTHSLTHSLTHSHSHGPLYAHHNFRSADDQHFLKPSAASRFRHVPPPTATTRSGATHVCAGPSASGLPARASRGVLRT